AVHLDLHHRTAVGEVEEGLAASGRVVVVDARRAVEAGGVQADLTQPALGGQLGEADAALASAGGVVGEHHRFGLGVEQLGGDGAHAGEDLRAGVGDGHAVEVAAAAGGRGRGVGHLVGPR